jgi:hypothetical protein
MIFIKIFIGKKVSKIKLLEASNSSTKEKIIVANRK